MACSSTGSRVLLFSKTNKKTNQPNNNNKKITGSQYRKLLSVYGHTMSLSLWSSRITKLDDSHSKKYVKQLCILSLSTTELYFFPLLSPLQKAKSDEELCSKKPQQQTNIPFKTKLLCRTSESLLSLVLQERL